MEVTCDLYNVIIKKRTIDLSIKLCKRIGVIFEILTYFKHQALTLFFEFMKASPLDLLNVIHSNVLTNIYAND